MIPRNLRGFKRDGWQEDAYRMRYQTKKAAVKKFNRLTLSGSELVSGGAFFENYRFRDEDGNVYFISQDNFKKILQQTSFKVKPKITRIWLEPTTEIQNI